MLQELDSFLIFFMSEDNFSNNVCVLIHIRSSNNKKISFLDPNVKKVKVAPFMTKPK